MPPTRIVPPAMRQPSRVYPSSDNAMVVLPEPDSPISATISPSATEKSAPLTIGTPAPAAGNDGQSTHLDQVSHWRTVRHGRAGAVEDCR